MICTVTLGSPDVIVCMCYLIKKNKQEKQNIQLHYVLQLYETLHPTYFS